MKFTTSKRTLTQLFAQIDFDKISPVIVKEQLGESLPSLIDNFTGKMLDDTNIVSNLIKLIEMADDPAKVTEKLSIEQLEKLFNITSKKGFAGSDEATQTVFYNFRKEVLDGDIVLLKIYNITDITDDAVATIGRIMQKIGDIDKYDDFIKILSSEQFVILAENSSKVLDNMNKYIIGDDALISIGPTEADQIITLMGKNGIDTEEAIKQIKNGIGMALGNKTFNLDNIDELLPIIKLAQKYGDESVDFDMDFITSVVKINSTNPDDFMRVERYLLMNDPNMVPATRNAFFLQKFIPPQQTNLLETMSKLGYKYDDLAEMGIKDMVSL
jgi:hypothetical protein